jgi:hypothetical protein
MIFLSFLLLSILLQSVNSFQRKQLPLCQKAKAGQYLSTKIRRNLFTKFNCEQFPNLANYFYGNLPDSERQRLCEIGERVKPFQWDFWTDFRLIILLVAISYVSSRMLPTKAFNGDNPDENSQSIFSKSPQEVCPQCQGQKNIFNKTCDLCNGLGYIDYGNPKFTLTGSVKDRTTADRNTQQQNRKSTVSQTRDEWQQWINDRMEDLRQQPLLEDLVDDEEDDIDILENERGQQRSDSKNQRNNRNNPSNTYTNSDTNSNINTDRSNPSSPLPDNNNNNNRRQSDAYDRTSGDLSGDE